MLTSLQTEEILSLLEKAGNEIMVVYASSDFGIKIKEDNSPVTIADLASDRIIKEGVGKITPGIEIFSEETKDIPYEIRSVWNPLWILDPLDGTKEFVARNGEFCISLALVLNHQPVAGFIHSPVMKETWMAIKGEGAFKILEGRRVALPFLSPSGTYRINVSRTHHSPKEEAWIDNFRKGHEVVTSVYGSAIKFCKIAEGISDIYPKFSLIHEWDIAAGHIIIEESGGKILESATLKPPVYNKSDYHQAPFIAFGKRIRDWEKLMKI